VAKSNGEAHDAPFWASWSDAKLLDLRLCDLGVTLAGSRLEEPIAKVCGELRARGLRLRPHFWLGEEWFSPDGVPGVAVPFHLTHPRLVRLERKHMLQVEGNTRSECLRLLRHEVGHAVQHAFALHRRPRWQQHFGRSSRAYPDHYRPNPASRRFVLHLRARTRDTSNLLDDSLFEALDGPARGMIWVIGLTWSTTAPAAGASPPRASCGRTASGCGRWSPAARASTSTPSTWCCGT